MEQQLILNAINRVEADLLIIKAELAKQSLSEHPVKLAKKQLRFERCLKMVAHQRVLDKKKAEKMFSARLEAVNEKLRSLKLKAPQG